MMKTKYITIVAGLWVGMSFLSCSSDEMPYGETIANKMGFNQWDSSLLFDKNHEESVTIGAAEGLSWDLSTYDSWITFSPTSGVGPQQVKVTVSDNDKTTTRDGSIDVQLRRFNSSGVISVSQTGSYFKVRDSKGKEIISDNNPNSDYQSSTLGETLTYDIEANANWEVVSNSSSIASIEPRSGKPGMTQVKIKIKENTGSSTIYPYIKFKTAASDKYCLNFKQESLYFYLYDSDWNVVSGTQSFSSAGETRTFHIGTNSTWSVSSKPDWITSVTPSSGDPGWSTSIEVKASKNSGTTSRSGTIKFKTKSSTTFELKVSQDGDIDIDQNATIQPDYLVTFTDGMVTNWKLGSSVNTFAYTVLSKSEAEKFSDEELVTVAFDKEYSAAVYKDHIFRYSVSSFTPNTNYCLCAVAKNSSGKRGPVLRYLFKTNSASLPYAEISDVKAATATTWQFDITLKNSAAWYYIKLWTGENNYNRDWHFVAYSLREYINKGITHSFDERYSSSRVSWPLNSETCKYATICTWGVSSSGAIGNPHVVYENVSSSARTRAESGTRGKLQMEAISRKDLEKMMDNTRLYRINR